MTNLLVAPDRGSQSRIRRLLHASLVQTRTNYLFWRQLPAEAWTERLAHKKAGPPASGVFPG